MSMSGGYTDMWRRRTLDHSDSGAERTLEWGSTQNERVRVLEERMEHQQRAIDRLADGVADSADRADAATKLAELHQTQMQPLLQRLVEHREADTRATGILRDELRTVSGRAQRQDEVVAGLREELAAFSGLSKQHEALRELVLSTQREQEGLGATLQGAREEHRRLLQQIGDFRREPQRLAEEIQEMRAASASTAEEVGVVVERLRGEMRDELQRIQARCDARIEAAERRALQAAQEAHRATEELREVRAALQRVADGEQQRRKRDAERGSLGESVRGAIEDIAQRMAGLERDHCAFRADYAEQVTKHKAHLAQQTVAGEETAAALQRVITGAEESRKEIATDLSGVRDWAARNMQRLKKRIEIAAQDLQQVRDQCGSLSDSQGRHAAAADREQRMLRELLRQQTDKASLLADMVDRHVDTRRDRWNRGSPATPVPTELADDPRCSPRRSRSVGARSSRREKRSHRGGTQEEYSVHERRR
eukprot:Hpha_TRINITY_DN13349_c0_g3::TRINITY_DN13349_c0_g3_i1::g.95190::m.95190